MKILFLCKRRYMNKDVVLERYARMYELPFQLARRGHEVRVECLSYHPLDDGDWVHDAAPGSLRWHSTQLTTLAGPARYAGRLWSQSRGFRPDLIFGGSDIPHCVGAGLLARRIRRPYAIDLYDNFESYAQARIPGAIAALRHAIRHADLVSSVSEPLTEHVRDEIGARGTLVTVVSTVDPAQFRPLDRSEARRQLGLPSEGLLVGTAGTLYRDKGVGTLYEAFQALAAERPDVHLCLAGPADPSMPPPASERVHYLGQIAHDRVPTFFSALDVGVVCIRDTPFGRFCFPQKAYELLACGTPIIAARVGAISDVLRSVPGALYQPNSAVDLARALREQLSARRLPVNPIPNWADVVAPLDAALSCLASPA